MGFVIGQTVRLSASGLDRYPSLYKVAGVVRAVLNSDAYVVTWNRSSPVNTWTHDGRDLLDEFGNPGDAFDTPPTTTKETNPKDAIGSDKLPLHLWPSTATALGSVALLNGSLKYGRGNFRAEGARASIYLDAAVRHLTAWYEGEDNDSDDNVPHLGAALACIAIVVDSQAAGTLVDDRAYPGGYSNFVKQLTPLVKELKERHKGRNPRHYDIWG
jgi:Domain of unknown function (DUF5664)